ncbi:hypothetical protein L1987_74753 [Smallanthus sonchifolius]|uniref:Uncharacterized protein n=1 Tax=Smallanthus sonchifolius TaxID=185202 RepID=A0ACB9A7Y3_9ASTR|nr:hypothetical protein L1987_74753 [Smallanthus sonchifolius]
MTNYAATFVPTGPQLTVPLLSLSQIQGGILEAVVTKALLDGVRCWRLGGTQRVVVDNDDGQYWLVVAEAKRGAGGRRRCHDGWWNFFRDSNGIG